MNSLTKYTEKTEFINNIIELMISQKRIHALTDDREILHELDMLVLRSTEILCNCNKVDEVQEGVILDFYMKCIMKDSNIILKIDSVPHLIYNVQQLMQVLNSNEML